MYHELLIKDIVRMIEGKSKIGESELIRGISINSKTTSPGELFFALAGEKTDGHLYTNEALDNGAVGVVVERSKNMTSEILVGDTLYALGRLAQKYREQFKPKTIAITGTNGKTTVKNLISAILGKKYTVLATKKNFNSLIGLPLTVFELSGAEDYMVLEMGTSNPGEIKRLCEIGQPMIGLITNIGPGHLKGLQSIEGIRAEKLSLLDSLPDHGFALLGDGVGEVERANVTHFSPDNLEKVELDEFGSHFVFQGRTFYTPLLGLSNVYNCLAAISLTSKIGIEYESQRGALIEVKSEHARLEPIYHNHLLIIDDTYNANPASMRAAIDFVANLKRSKVLILGDMRELGSASKQLHQEIGVYARARSNELLTYGDEAKYYGGSHFKDRSALMGYLKKILNGKEVILVKASRALHFEYFVEQIVREF